MTGIIKNLKEKGFGFIVEDGADKDKREVFFHMNGLVDVRFEELNEGDHVSYDVEETQKGLNAVNVKRI